jgi:hypothetical protein
MVNSLKNKIENDIWVSNINDLQNKSENGIGDSNGKWFKE